MSKTLSEKQILYFQGKNKFYFDFYAGGLAGVLGEMWTACSIQAKNIYVGQPSLNKMDYMINIFKQATQLINIYSVIQSTGTPAIMFSIKEALKRQLLTKVDPKANPQKFYSGNLIIGGVAGIVGITISYPFASNEHSIINTLQHTTEVIKNDGFLALYKGFGVSMLGAFVYRAIYFGGYDLGKVIIWGDDDMKHNISLPHNSLTAVIAVFLGKSLEQPFLAIKTEMNNKRNVFQSQNAWKCLISIFRQKGVNGLFVYQDIYLLYNADLFALIFYDRFQKQWIQKQQKKMN